jgi:hypothetical protein
MPTYRCYFFDREGHPARTEERDCPGVEAAIEWAGQALAAHDDAAAVELWQTHTLVHRQQR